MSLLHPKTRVKHVDSKVGATTAHTHHVASDLTVTITPPAATNTYIKEAGKAYDTSDEQQLIELRSVLREYADYNDTLSIVINLTSMFMAKKPIILCEDSENQETLQNFFERQGFQEFLQNFCREFLISGEVTSYCEWDPEHNCFTDEQILNPDELTIKPSAFTNQATIYSPIPPALSEIINDPQNPDYEMVCAMYPDIVDASHRNELIRLADSKIIRCVNKNRDWNLRGYPFFTPALSALSQEDSLDAARYTQLQELATPLIWVTAGLVNSAKDYNYMPSRQQLDNIRNEMRDLMAARTRIGVFPIGIDVKNVFSGMQIADLSRDYERCESKILRVVGAGKGLLDGSGTSPFASNAINRDIYTSFIETQRVKIIKAFQKRIDQAIRHLHLYAYRVNEQGERCQVYDKQTGEPLLESASLGFDTKIMKDANSQLDTLMKLQHSDVPIAKQTLADASGLDINVYEELRQIEEEKQVVDNTGTQDTMGMQNNPNRGHAIPSMSDRPLSSPLDKRNF